MALVGQRWEPSESCRGLVYEQVPCAAAMSQPGGTIGPHADMALRRMGYGKVSALCDARSDDRSIGPLTSRHSTTRSFFIASAGRWQGHSFRILFSLRV